MKVKLKSDLPHKLKMRYYRYLCHLTVGKCYEATFTPLMYDPNTFESVRCYIITCDDGYARKFPLDYFITLEEWRDLQLEKLL